MPSEHSADDTDRDVYVDHCDVCQMDREWERYEDTKMFICVCGTTTSERSLRAGIGQEDQTDG